MCIHKIMTKKCNECKQTLVSLYLHRRINGKLKWEKIEEMYCINCKKPMIATNWFNGE